MTVQEWIERVGYINKEVTILQLERERCLSVVKDICGSDCLPVAVTGYMEMIQKSIDKLCKQKRSVIGVISLVENKTLQQLLALRYIKCMTWEDVAEEMNYSDYWLRKGLHKKALAEAAKIIKERTCKK